MRFRSKIGLSLALLSFLTVATGCIGLLFIHRVLDALAGVVGTDLPLDANLAELNRHVQRALSISAELTENREMADTQRLRDEFDATAEKLSRSLERARRELATELSADALDQVEREHSRLAEKTGRLADALVAELRAQAAFGDAQTRSELRWARLLDALGDAAVGSGSPRRAEGNPDGREGPALRPTVEAESLFALVQLQKESLEARTRAQEYLALDDVGAMRQEADQLARAVSEAEARVVAIAAGAALPAGTAAAFRGWSSHFLADDGPLRAALELETLRTVTDAVVAEVGTEFREVLRIVDSVIALGGRLALSRDARGFVSAAPALLVTVVALAAAVSVALAVVLTHTMSRPVKELIAHTEAVARGDYDRRLEARSGDELGELGAAFNRMMDEVRRSHEQVAVLNTGLERRVRERTTELEQEIARRQRVEDSLRESQDRYRTLIENLPGGFIALLDRRHEVVAFGGQSLRPAASGGSAPLVAGSRLADLCPAGMAAELEQRLEAALRGERQEFECAADGLEWRVVMVATPRPGRDDTQSVTVLTADVTEARRAEREMRKRERQLIQADKLASLGVLVAGVAHEINNPNQAILTTAQLLRRAWPDMRKVLDARAKEEGDFLVGGMEYAELRDALEQQIDGVLHSSRRIEAIVRSLREFARQDPSEATQPVNINVVVRSALILLGNMLKSATDNLTVTLSPRVPTFAGSAQRVEQVVVNLVQNACQALRARSEGVAISTYVGGGNRVVLEVADQGVGIPAQDLARIRDPFFTTKRETGGTGLGLSVAATIVAEHRGELEFQSTPGTGTTVRVLFPGRTA